MSEEHGGENAGASSGVSAQEAGEAAFLEVLRDAVDAVEAAGLPYVLMGGFASAALGRERWTHDIDFFVKQQDARRVLAILREAGFDTEETNQEWLYKAFKKGVLVDVIFASADDLYLEDDTLERAQFIEFRGQRFKVIPPEDLLVIKASVFKEETPRHWFDGLGIIRTTELDWEYLVKKSRPKAERVLSLLLYAKGSGLEVPEHALDSIWALARGHHGGQQAPDEEPDDYVAARLREALGQDGLEVQVNVKGRHVYLTGAAGGAVSEEELKSRVERLAPGYQVHDQTTPAEYPEREEVERLW